MMHVVIGELEKISLPDELSSTGTAVTIGSFDGVHRGHQTLIRQLVEQAEREGLSAGLITFHPHPSAILTPHAPIPYLTTLEEKLALLKPLGLDWVAVLSFTSRLAHTPAREFVRLLLERFNLRIVWVGEDFALGYRRKGDVPALREMGREMGFRVHAVPFVTNGEAKISSTRIRALLLDGQVRGAARLLGRLYALSGEVVHGARRGRCIGFPTANIEVPHGRVVPANGVYATYALLGGERYLSVTNIGVRPSFDHGARSIEAHLLDFERDIYGQRLKIEFVARLRDERRFADVGELIAQIGRDVEMARQILDEGETWKISARKNRPDGPSGWSG